MNYIEWDSSFCLGIAAIDAEHKGLVAIINELHAAMKARRAGEEVDAVLDKMCAYAFDHFRTEETLMERYTYPGLDEHRAAHEEFVRIVDAMTRAVSPLRPMQVQHFLDKWLRGHVLEMDAKAAAFLKSRGVR
ncbi:MAG: hemerythrin family protein [Desulfovibrionaceae bacterium]|jgi:methyl-accepting chemotaxis protein/hemerythrin|nr:hemerythrin family protein [Desulfovibrionaceae bacterium]